ncbi:hypothetical protein [Paucibacter soli]|uniref:hypothetical protein n=1 Tax=Paucibacter soli TaxID=3133433 RepID=UPI0030AF241E
MTPSPALPCAAASANDAKKKLALLKGAKLIRRGKPVEAVMHYRAKIICSPKEAMLALGLQK